MTAFIRALARDMRASTGQRLSLRANFSWTLVGNVVYAACQWGMLTVLAKLGSPEAVGQFSLGLAVGAPVMMLANLQLRQIQATDARREYAFGDYLALRLLTTALAYGVIVALALSAGYRAEVVAVILALGLQKAFQSLSDVYHGLLQQRERMDRIARSLLLKGPLALAALAVAYALSRSVAVAALALAGVYAAVWLGYDRHSARLVAAEEPLRPRWSRARLQRLAWLALPLGLVMMLISLNGNIPRYIIERTLGEAELGIYSAMAYLQVAGGTVVSALGQSASPRLAQHYAAGQYGAFRRLLLRLVGLGAGLGAAAVLGALLLGRPLLTLLYTAEFAAQSHLLVWIMAAAGVSYVSATLLYPVSATRRFPTLLIPYLVQTCLTALAALLLVPNQGLGGAALATGLSALLGCMVSPALLFGVLGIPLFGDARVSSRQRAHSKKPPA